MELIHCSQLNLVYHQETPEGTEGKSIGQRVTDAYEFDYILTSHQGKMITEGETLDVIPGMFFVRSPGTKVEGINRYSSWYLQFQTEENLEIPCSLCILPANLCQPVFRRIYDLHVQQPVGYQYEIDYYMNTLLFYLYQEQNRQKQNEKKNHPLAGIREEIEQNWNKNYPLDHYVRMSGYSKSRFCHLFQELYSISPIQFMHEVRMQKLCYQLIETERPVKELMVEHGYKNEQSFYRLFKEHTGETPLSYRQKHRIRHPGM